MSSFSAEHINQSSTSSTDNLSSSLGRKSHRLYFLIQWSFDAQVTDVPLSCFVWLKHLTGSGHFFHLQIKKKGSSLLLSQSDYCIAYYRHQQVNHPKNAACTKHLSQAFNTYWEIEETQCDCILHILAPFCWLSVSLRIDFTARF